MFKMSKDLKLLKFLSKTQYLNQKYKDLNKKAVI